MSLLQVISKPFGMGGRTTHLCGSEVERVVRRWESYGKQQRRLMGKLDQHMLQQFAYNLLTICRIHVALIIITRGKW